MDGGPGQPDLWGYVTGPATNFPADQAGCEAIRAAFPPFLLLEEGNITIHE